MRGIILLGLVVNGGLPHFVAGGVVQRAEDLVDLLKQRGVALAQTHAGALGRKREAAALREGDEAEVGVGGEIAGGIFNGDVRIRRFAFLPAVGGVSALPMQTKNKAVNAM